MGLMRTTRLLPALALTAAMAVGVSACGSNDTGNSTSGTSAGSSSSGSSKTSSDAPATISGAGSTFAATVYQQWGSDLKNQGITLNYQGVGSGAGVAALQAGTVNFAGSDPALKPEDVSGLKKGSPVQVPMFFGAITVSYNLPGVQSGL